MIKDIDRKRIKDLETLVVLSIVFLILFLTVHKIAFVVVSVLLLLIGLLFKKATSFIVNCWLKLAELIAVFNTKLILSIIFYVFLTPIAWLYRHFAKDPLCLKRMQSQTSYYHPRDHLYVKEDFEKMW